MPDYQLQSTWEEVDSAAQVIKNGVQKSNLAPSVKASIEKADGSIQKSSQLPASDWDTTVAGVDDEGKIVVRPSFSDEAKYSLLSLLSDVAYATPNGAAKLADLEDKLFPIRHLTSITADYQQDRAIYDTDPLDVIKTSDDLTVTAHYSDGTSEVLADEDYTLSGTLTVGTSTITVSYEGKSTTIEVIVMASPTTTYIRNWDFTQSLDDSVEGVTASLQKISGDAPVRTSAGVVFDAATQMIYLGELSLAGKTIEIDVSSFSFAGISSAHIRFLMCPSTETSNYGLGALIYRAGEGWTAYGTDGSRKWATGYYATGTDSSVVNMFNGKTVKLVFDSTGVTKTLYLDDTLIGSTGTVTVGDFLYIGGIRSGDQSSGNQCYNMTIRGIRIYENEVA